MFPLMPFRGPDFPNFAENVALVWHLTWIAQNPCTAPSLNFIKRIILEAKIPIFDEAVMRRRISIPLPSETIHFLRYDLQLQRNHRVVLCQFL